MTRKEFEKFRLLVGNEEFRGDYVDPITYGIQRAIFEKERLNKLIAAAETVNMQTARTKAAQWKRQLVRISQSQARFEKLRDEMQQNRAAAERRQAMAK